MNNKLLKIAALFIVFNMQYTISNKQLKAQSVGINATGVPPDTSAALDIDITTGGLLIPRLTTTQRDNIVSPVLSLMIFNITDSCLQIYSGVNWENIYCLGDTACITPSTPGAITGNDTVCSGTAGEPYSIAVVSGAASYNWTVPSGATVTSGQGTTSITVDFGSASGNVSVTASNSCGTSANNSTITVITIACIQPSCLAWFNAGFTIDGTYSIDPDGAGVVAPFNAYCDMSFDGGGWTLVAQATEGLAYNPLSSVPLSTDGFLNDTAYTALKAVATLGYMFVHPGTGSRFLMSPIDSVDTYSCHSMNSLLSNNSVAGLWAWAWDETTGCDFVGSDYSAIVLFDTNILSVYQLSTKQDLKIWNGTAWVTSGTVNPVGSPAVIEIWIK